MLFSFTVLFRATDQEICKLYFLRGSNPKRMFVFASVQTSLTKTVEYQVLMHRIPFGILTIIFSENSSSSSICRLRYFARRCPGGRSGNASDRISHGCTSRGSNRRSGGGGRSTGGGRRGGRSRGWLGRWSRCRTGGWSSRRCSCRLRSRCTGCLRGCYRRRRWVRRSRGGHSGSGGRRFLARLRAAHLSSFLRRGLHCVPRGSSRSGLGLCGCRRRRTRRSRGGPFGIYINALCVSCRCRCRTQARGKPLRHDLVLEEIQSPLLLSRRGRIVDRLTI